MNEDSEEVNELDAIVDALPHTKEWRDGFEVGVLYVLMTEQCDYIAGKCARTNEETIFALARRAGYTCEWKPERGNEKTQITLCLLNADDAEDG